MLLVECRRGHGQPFPLESVGILQDTGVSTLPRVNRVVIVGNKISPGNPVTNA